MVKFGVKIKIFRTYNFLCRKFAAICCEVETFCPPTFLTDDTAAWLALCGRHCNLSRTTCACCWQLIQKICAKFSADVWISISFLSADRYCSSWPFNVFAMFCQCAVKSILQYFDLLSTWWTSRATICTTSRLTIGFIVDCTCTRYRTAGVGKRARSPSLYHSRQYGIVLIPRLDCLTDYTVVCFTMHDCGWKLRKKVLTQAKYGLILITVDVLYSFLWNFCRL